MTHEQLLEGALKALLKAARPAVVAQERKDYWEQFGTGSSRWKAADARHTAAIAALERAEAMAAAALRGNVTLFYEAESPRHTGAAE